jgi:hypothetical protein
MQSVIRSSKAVDFSSISRFLELKKNHELRSTEEVVQKIIDLINSPRIDHEVICAV